MKGLMLSLAGFALVLCSAESVIAQEMMIIKPEKPVVCYQRFEDRHDHIGISEKFNQWRQQPSGRTKSATIEVEYIGFPSDGKAMNAFQYAVEIWESELVSPVPIRMQAEWRPLGSGVLGQAIWGSAYANFGGEQFSNVFYPVALAEKIVGHEINGPSRPDIFASFNSNASWYLETDGNTPSGQMDLVTIVLHEIAHGLGFIDTYNVRGLEGSVGVESGGATVPFVFDLFVENEANLNLLHNFPSPSNELRTQLQSSALFFSSPLSSGVLNGERPKLYAPSTFASGSSISHLDEGTFSGDQDANRLMTPHIAPAESIHDLGPVLRASLADMGWVYTLIGHEPLQDAERSDGLPYPVNVRIVSDQGYDPSTLKLHYTSDGIDYTTVDMLPTATPDEFESTLPGTTVEMDYAYYISVDDVDGRSFTNPGIRQVLGAQPEQGTHFFHIGSDVTPPEIWHDPVRFISDNSDLVLLASVSDNQGISEVLVEYALNDEPVMTALMQEGTLPDEYTLNISLPPLSPDDEIRYRLIARDVALIENIAHSPATGFYTIDVTGILPVQDSYTNNFNEASADFFGDEFSVITPEGFGNGAIHSNHPYANGTGPNNESNYTYQLQIPIRISVDNPVIRFDEIVLVEPGAENSVFGDDDFYDYVVVEGSADGGLTWLPFAPGYDARAVEAWRLHYNSNMSGDNSQAKGEPTHFRSRSINMLESGSFSESDEVLIRFRLFADQLAHGWGWAIDNLAIQPPITSVEEPLEEAPHVYPVPASRQLFVDLQNTPGPSVMIEITDVAGKVVFRHTARHESGAGPFAVDVQLFPNGLYILRLTTSRGSVARKFLKTDE